MTRSLQSKERRIVFDLKNVNINSSIHIVGSISAVIELMQGKEMQLNLDM